MQLVRISEENNINISSVRNAFNYDIWFKILAIKQNILYQKPEWCFISYKMKKMRQNNLSQTKWAKHWTSIERNTCGKNLLKHFWRPVAQVKHIKKFIELRTNWFFLGIKSIDNNKTIKIMFFRGRAAKQPMKTTRIHHQKKSTMKLYQRAVVYVFVAVDQAYW